MTSRQIYVLPFLNRQCRLSSQECTLIVRSNHSARTGTWNGAIFPFFLWAVRRTCTLAERDELRQGRTDELRDARDHATDGLHLCGVEARHQVDDVGDRRQQGGVAFVVDERGEQRVHQLLGFLRGRHDPLRRLDAAADRGDLLQHHDGGEGLGGEAEENFGRGQIHANSNVAIQPLTSRNKHGRSGQP